MPSSVLSMLGATSSEVLTAGVAAVAVYAFVIAATRLTGLRSCSKMSAFDFAMTIAIGSLIASAASGQAPLATVLIGVGVLFLLQ